VRASGSKSLPKNVASGSKSLPKNAGSVAGARSHLGRPLRVSGCPVQIAEGLELLSSREVRLIQGCRVGDSFGEFNSHLFSPFDGASPLGLDP
jgi:hypothetical protein